MLEAIKELKELEEAMREWAARHWADPANQRVLEFADRVGKVRGRVDMVRKRYIAANYAVQSELPF